MRSLCLLLLLALAGLAAANRIFPFLNCVRPDPQHEHCFVAFFGYAAEFLPDAGADIAFGPPDNFISSPGGSSWVIGNPVTHFVNGQHEFQLQVRFCGESVRWTIVSPNGEVHSAQASKCDECHGLLMCRNQPGKRDDANGNGGDDDDEGDHGSDCECWEWRECEERCQWEEDQDDECEKKCDDPTWCQNLQGADPDCVQECTPPPAPVKRNNDNQDCLCECQRRKAKQLCRRFKCKQLCHDDHQGRCKDKDDQHEHGDGHDDNESDHPSRRRWSDVWNADDDQKCRDDCETQAARRRRDISNGQCRSQCEAKCHMRELDSQSGKKKRGPFDRPTCEADCNVQCHRNECKDKCKRQGCEESCKDKCMKETDIKQTDCTCDPGNSDCIRQFLDNFCNQRCHDQCDHHHDCVKIRRNRFCPRCKCEQGDCFVQSGSQPQKKK